MNRVLLPVILLSLAALSCSLILPASQSSTPTAAPAASYTLPPPTPTAEVLPTATSLPADPPTPLPTLPPTSTVPTGPRPTASPLHYQILQEVWNAVNSFYLYRDFNGLDWNAVLQEYTTRVQAGLTDEEFYAALGEMIHRLGDNHSNYFSPENARQMDIEFAGAAGYAGIGVVHTPLPERKKLSVILVYPGSPAELAGIRPHDSILAVDGQSIFDEQGNRRDVLRGPEGSTIQVTVQTPGQPPRQVPITRQFISGEMPVPHRVYTTPGGKRVGYLLLRTFNESGLAERVGLALNEMLASGPLDALIVDNRHNTGGAIDVLFNTLAYFTRGEVGKFDQQGEVTPINISPVEMVSQNLPLVVLVGRDTVSSGEVFAGIIQDLGRGAIIGEETPGNVEMLKIFDFSDGSRAWIANATFRPLNQPEVDWEQTGILPDYAVSSQWDEVTDETDPIIQAALQYFDGALPISTPNP